MTDSKTTKASLARDVARLTEQVSDLRAQLSRAEALRQGSLDNGAQLMAVLGIDNTLSSSAKIQAAQKIGNEHKDRAAHVAGLQQALVQERALTDHLLVVLRRGR